MGIKEAYLYKKLKEKKVYPVKCRRAAISPLAKLFNRVNLATKRFGSRVSRLSIVNYDILSTPLEIFFILSIFLFSSKFLTGSIFRAVNKLLVNPIQLQGLGIFSRLKEFLHFLQYLHLFFG